MARYLVPLAVFIAMVAFLAVGLTRDPREVPSPLVDKPAPEFRLPRVESVGVMLSEADLRGQVSLVNVWASWCVSCRDEHPLLMDLAASGEVPIYGLNYKDARDDALAWLARFGNPYDASAHDLEGLVGIDWGVYGVPETFVVDAEGYIRHKHIGPLTQQDIDEEILPLVRRLKGRS